MTVDVLVARSDELDLASNTSDTTINATVVKDETIITRPPPTLTRSWSLPNASTRRTDNPAPPVLTRASSLPVKLVEPATDIDSDSSSVWTWAWSDEMQGPATSKRCGTRWIARLLPFFMLMLVGYATYDVVVYCCVEYFIQEIRKTATAIVLIVFYTIFFILMVAAYIRCYVTIQFNTGFVPWTAAREAAESERNERSTNGGDVESLQWSPADTNPDSPGLEAFYSKDVFICESDGLPKWCSECRSWKPDRAHHSSEYGRCVYKMDHVCPWMGGIISETSLRFVFQNITNVDLFRKNQTFRLAVRVPTGTRSTDQFTTITYPLSPPGDDSRAPGTAHSNGVDQSDGAGSIATNRMAARDQRAKRTFAILQTQSGENPWHVGYRNNFKSVMGETIFEWFLPLRHSPCTRHDSMVSDYEFGPLVEELKRRYGLAEEDAEKGANETTSS
ncbi:palmitoyltransferase PFA5 [Fusarium graminearum PH-1]|uniref:palmitoyltransferase PFA5 n=1 Tax=Gibberella zeae (strain ATCC MYA-4620 / CBS 123657 / FGSC 9075 / NRRL 31084 / PH-1) TaxID=229533 RepID=UPI00021F230D|nr:palmitoyltransferase PFA5 [Fusarium graminearum PH-1]ESU14361.1 palmitoyltransferase PFA5 [Fusarium graminearum PH-1]|eukprot:XP_011319786.1 palmitoyltransferase PFA5 [Fusarium graminearum PH-1]